MENSGKLLITAVNAAGVKGEDLFSKADLYVVIKFGGKTVKTKTAKNQECPVWNETFSFPYQNDNNSNVEVTVMDDDLFKDDKVTTAYISFNQFPSFGEEKEYSIPLSFKNNDVGILHLRMKNDSKGNNYNYNNYNNNKNINSVNDSSNINMKNNNNLGGYDNTGLGGHSYGNSNNNNNNQGREFYHNVVETHYINGQPNSSEQNLNNINNLNPNRNIQYNNDATLQTRDNNYLNLNSNQYNNNKQHEYNSSLHPHHNTATTTSTTTTTNVVPNNTNYTTHPIAAATVPTVAATGVAMKNIKDRKKKKSKIT